MDVPVTPEEQTQPEDAPEETKTTFWGQVGEFFGALMWGLP